MNKTIIIIILSLIIVIGVLGFGYDKVKENAYQQGIQDASLLVYQQIYQQLNSQGFITYNYFINESTVIPLKLGVIK